MLGTFSCLHKDLAADMEQLFHSFAQQVSVGASPEALTRPRRVSSLVLRLSSALPQLPQSSRLLAVGGVCGARRCEEVGDFVSQRAGHSQCACGPGEFGQAGRPELNDVENFSLRLSLSPSSASESVLSPPPEAADGQTWFWAALPGDGGRGGQPGSGPEPG